MIRIYIGFRVAVAVGTVVVCGETLVLVFNFTNAGIWLGLLNKWTLTLMNLAGRGFHSFIVMFMLIIVMM